MIKGYWKYLKRLRRQIRLRLDCLQYGHKWDNTHGYYDMPNSGAECRHCGKKLK
jgi:hypothetical protein